MKKKLKPLLEYFTESSSACLLAMVQGNVLTVTAVHISIAAQTGLFASLIAFFLLSYAKVRKRWIIALLLGSVTAIVDYFSHPGMIGSKATEALITGIAAGLLTYLFSFLMDVFYRNKNQEI